MNKIVTLDNNITLILEKMPEMQTATFGIWFATGSVNEEPEEHGISHFIEHMMFKGTSTMDAKELAEAADKIGASMNAFTGKEYTCYHMRTLSSFAPKGLAILLEMVTDSLFDPDEMEREKKVIYEEMKMLKDSPDGLARELASELVYKGEPLGRSIIGTEESLSKMDQAMLKNYIKKHYSKERLVISIAGNFDEETIIAMAKEKLDCLGETSPKLVYDEVPYKPGFGVISKDIEQSHICMSQRGLCFGHEDEEAVDVVNCILGSGMSSRLFQNVREKKGLAYSVYSGPISNREKGMFTIYAGVGHDKIKDAVEAIKEELLILRRDGVTKEEVEKAKIKLTSNYAFAQESVAARMQLNGRFYVMRKTTCGIEEIIEKTNAVSDDKIREYIDYITDIDNYSGALVTNGDTDIESCIKA